MRVGFIANPASGKDIRRLTARASVFDNQEKAAIVRRCVAGIEGVCPSATIRYYPDSHQITQAALGSTQLPHAPVDMVCTRESADSTLAAAYMADVDVLVSLGGDGTNRAIAKSLSQDIPLVALSTGTNNAFPTLCEATSAGLATAYVGMGRVHLDTVAPKTKVVHVQFEDSDSDIALIDVVGTTDRFVGSRALVEPAKFVYAVLSVADPSKVGMTAIGGLVDVVDDTHDRGLMLSFGKHDHETKSQIVYAPVAPGMVQPVNIDHKSRVNMHESVGLSGATVLAFDGERERSVDPKTTVTYTIKRDGPRRVDVAKCLRLIANSRTVSCNDRQVGESRAF